jgi:DNA-directed RNA polymerase specialized sigma24 family protein
VTEDVPITHWIERLRAGDQDEAARGLWEQYFEKLVGFARHKLKDCPRRVEDEEDVALSVLRSFCEAAKKGRFPNLEDRNGLLKLLLSITARKAVDRIRFYNREKRRVKGESALGGEGPDDEMGISPSPEFFAITVENCTRLLDLLGDNELSAVALMKVEGYTNEEIAIRQDRSLRSIERQLRLIRMIWRKESSSE